MGNIILEHLIENIKNGRCIGNLIVYEHRIVNTSKGKFINIYLEKLKEIIHKGERLGDSVIYSPPFYD